ncbi:hypothetical protein Ancab_022627 [Ancistrocladus abbreviatus]
MPSNLQQTFSGCRSQHGWDSNSFSLSQTTLLGISNNEEQPESGLTSLSPSNKESSLTEVVKHGRLTVGAGYALRSPAERTDCRLVLAARSDVAILKRKKQSSSQLGVQRLDQEHKKQEKGSCIEELSASTSKKKSNSGPIQTPDAALGISGSCPFKKNSASVKDWMSAKASLSGSPKKKNMQTSREW